jgi:hypothetical protein
MELKLENLKKPSNKKFKRIADYLLYTHPLISGALMAIPIEDSLKLWVIFGLNTIVILIKGATKFTAEETVT